MRRRTPQTALSAHLRRQFSARVRLYRMERGLTQKELGRAAGLAREFISQVECKRSSVTIETIAAIADALQVSPGALLGADENLPRSVIPSPAHSKRAAIGMTEAAYSGEPEGIAYCRQRKSAAGR